MNKVSRIVSAFAFSFAAMAAHAAPQATVPAPVRNVVLVHGFFADGSGWRGVADILARDGFHVAVVQQPETSLADDVRATVRALDAQDGPSILVGHSYGGMVITEAGNDSRVAGLVYVAAFQPDAGESLKQLADKIPPATKGIKATPDGYLYFDPALFHADFAADLPAVDARFMASSQVAPAVQAATAPVSQASWKTKPSWAIVSKDDRTVNPDLERFMARRAGSTTVEIGGSHVAFIAHPDQVAKVIEQAAMAASRR